MSRTITVRDEIYSKLRKLKKDRESYSDVIEDLLRENEFVPEAAGAAARYAVDHDCNIHEAIEKILLDVAKNQQAKDRVFEDGQNE